VPLTKSLSRALQRQIDLTTAVCQERLLATHVRHVLAFVELVDDQVPFDEALDIYVRILQLNAEQARNIGSRALAELGRRNGVSPEEMVPKPMPEDEGDGDEPVPAGEARQGRSAAAFGRLRRRIRGRVQADLRQRINLAAARAEDALFETHVQNALIFVKALASEAPPAEAAEHYLETMMLPEGLADVIYNRALRTLADDVLPQVEGDRPVARAPQVATSSAPAG
jgi:hypothetical protein